MRLTDLSVFVYGTLKPGGHYWPEFCEGKVDEPVPAKIKGTLYDLHLGYPGLRLSGEGWVQGYLLTFRNETDFGQVDYLEGYEAGRPYEENEYIRYKVDCYSASGERLGKCWAYEITESTMAECKCTQIPDGDWPVNTPRS